MGLFQPTDAKGNTSATPSPAEQEMAKYRLQVLSALLNSRTGPRPGFSDFVHHGTRSGVQAGLPAGLSGGLSTVLEAMNKPGGFTSRGSTKTTPAGPSGVQDIASTILLGLMLKNAIGGSSGGTSGGGLSDLWNRYFGSGSGVDPAMQVGQTNIDWSTIPDTTSMSADTSTGDAGTDQTSFNWGDYGF